MNFRQQTYGCCLALAGLLVVSCGGEPDSVKSAPADDPVALALATVQEYVDGYYHQFPEDAYMFGYPDPPIDRFGDHSPDGLAAWHAREDAWLKTLRDIDPDSLEETGAAMPYAFVFERLEASRDLRVCRFELWTMSRDWLGWYEFLPANFSGQAVGTDGARAAVLAARET